MPTLAVMVIGDKLGIHIKRLEFALRPSQNSKQIYATALHPINATALAYKNQAVDRDYNGLITG